VAALLGGGRVPAAAQVAAPVAARATIAGGKIVHLEAEDTVPVRGTRVLLHRVGLSDQGPIDSVMTDARGRFTFRFHADSGALYMVSARHQGIEYFSSPLIATAERPDTTVTIVVADTSSAAAVRVVARHIVITRPGDDGSRNILDLSTLQNDGHQTRVAPDTLRPVWTAPLPAGIDSLEVGQGDFSPEAVSQRGDSVFVFAPIAPGEKQLTIDYRLPPAHRTVAFSVPEPVVTVNVLLEEFDAHVSGLVGVTVDTQTVEERTFRRWHGAVPAGGVIRIEFAPGRPNDRPILIGLVALVVLVLAGAAWRYRVLGAAVLLLVVLACRPAEPGQAAIRVVDDAGDTTTLAVPARRVVSLIPATTELLFAIGAGDAVVGRTKWCDYPQASQAVPSVGDGVNPNVEAVLARRPDLVLFYRSVQHTATVARLRSLGVPALQLNTDALADVPRLARMLGRLTGHERSADSLVTAFGAELAAVSPAAAARRPSVLLLVWEQPPMTVGTGSFLSELVERAGGTNLFADISATSAAVSIEAVAARDPDVVLLASEGPLAFASRPEWQVVRAVREHRFARVSGSAFGHPGPRSPAAIEELARQLQEFER